jgi:salicylate hydroxylase
VAGRLALIGDAAHAMAPFLAQGAAMAIEDAAVLAASLAGGDVPSALAAYAAARRPRTARVAAASRRTGTAYHLGGLAAAARNAVLGAAGGGFILSRNDWIYRWRSPA